MKLRLFHVISLLLCASSLWAAPLKLDLLRVGSKTYSNVTVIGANATDLYFMHSHGISNVKLKYLAPDLQKRFDYDPEEARTAEKQQVEEDTNYQNNLLSNVVARAQ